MDIFKKDKKSKKQFFLLKTLFILSGLLQGVSVVLTTSFFKHLFAQAYSQVWVDLLYIGATATACFLFHLLGINIGNHMAIWEICDAQIHRVGSAITKLPLGWFDASSKGKVSKAISTDINTLTHYPSIILPEILTVLSASAVIALSLVFISIQYGFVIAVMSVFMIYFWKENTKALKTVEEQNAVSNQKMESTVVEFAQLQPVLRASGALIDGWDRLETSLNSDKNATIKTLKTKGKNLYKFMLTANVGTILILALSSFELMHGKIEIHIFVGIVVAMMRFSSPLAGLLGYASEIFNIQSAMRRIDSIVKADKLPEPKENLYISDNNKKGMDIEFKNVDFGYTQSKQVLKNINLNMPAGSITALVGASGSGKSTIHRLIGRFWDVDRGAIIINGQNIKNIKTENLMDLISMVFQEVYLFNTTIRENLLIAKPGATEGELLNAAKKSRLDEVIQRLPNGWDTKVGEGGSSLSGGEKQRVSIARAFLKDAPILLLDEITSALDGVNEAIITKSLEELSKNRTVVVIAHRLTSIKNSDAIAVVDNGEITGYGTHEKLLKTNDRYANLWNALVTVKQWKV